MLTYRILSFDGGGIRGLLSLVLLERLEKEVPRWLDKTDLLAGTSTGGRIVQISCLMF
jgi:patatin-like phospholipase/acyl hydrolase